jgi:DNA-binding NarL/FixJ family response regulator
MAGDAGEGTFGGAHAGIAKIIRLIIASPVHLVRDGLAATLRGLAGLIVVDVTDLSPCGIAKIADARPGTVLVDLGQTDPAATARAIKAVCRRARFVAFAVDETDDHVFASATAGFCGYVAPESGAEELYRALVDVRWKPACTARRISRRQRLLASLDCSGSSTRKRHCRR